METQSAASIVADLIGMPDWFPKAVRRGAALVLLGTLIICPTTFEHGLSIFADRQAAAFLNRIQPLLDAPATPNPMSPNPATKPQPGHAHRLRTGGTPAR